MEIVSENHCENTEEACKYCNLPENEEDDLLQCTACLIYLHIRCTKRGSVPGGICGDVFFTFTCADCTESNVEEFVRGKSAWFHIIYLVLYNYSKRSPGISRHGFYHWKLHVASFIDQNWEMLFGKDTKRRKMWIGTISGCLSVYNNFLFTSGTTILTEAGWWTLTFPNLKPRYILKYTRAIADLKQNKVKEFITLEECLSSNTVPDFYLRRIDLDKIAAETLLASNNTSTNDVQNSCNTNVAPSKKDKSSRKKQKRKAILPTIENIGFVNTSKIFKPTVSFSTSFEPEDVQINRELQEKPVILKDPMCHYNTSLNSISRIEGLRLSQKLMGTMLDDCILSPYSGLYLKPYIRRDAETKPAWIALMTDVVRMSITRHGRDYKVPGRYTLDYVYVQPGHIPAINSLCNHFFWPGIDLTDCLQYPEFSCVAMYRRLIVGFAFIVPDVGINEGYISFVFVRPGWRNVGIAKFMIYHLIQICSGKDITLHVSINNPALFLYQKFGFKVEKVVLDFYDKYFRRDSFESKHAFFCRLER